MAEHNSTGNRGLIIAGGVLCILGSLVAIGIGGAFFPIGIILLAPGIAEIVLASCELANKGRGVNIAAGVIGLFCGGIIGGILLLVGASQN